MVFRKGRTSTTHHMTTRISDLLKARLDEMRERHAQTDRELLEARERCYQALDRLKAAADEFTDD